MVNYTGGEIIGKMSKSIIQKDKKCYVCESQYNLHNHHIMFGKNRKKADKDGLTVYLCLKHHEGQYGVHGKGGHDLDLLLKRIAEDRWLSHYEKTIDDFIKRYGRNYL